VALAWLACAGTSVDPPPGAPNVLFVVYDDLNRDVGTYGHPQAVTPNLDRLAREGMRFDNAHSNGPSCGPSRASFLTGLYASTTGIYTNERFYEIESLRDLHSIFEHARARGYRVYGAGKIFHGNWGPKPVARRFDEQMDVSTSQRAVPTFRGEARRHPAVPLTRRDDVVNAGWGPLSDVPTAEKYGEGWEGWGNFRYASDDDRDPMRDERVAAWAVERIRETRDRPFFLTVGFRRPHVPLYAPKRFFDLYDPATLTLPAVRLDDLDDVVPTMHRSSRPARVWKNIQALPNAEAVWRDYYRAYLACVSFGDEQLGKLLDALDETGLAANTVVVVTSDHGYHWGDKLRVGKSSPWNGTTRIPLIVRAPGLTTAGSATNRPVSLIDLFPTFVDLMQLAPAPHGAAFPLDGASLVPLLRDPSRTDDAHTAALFQRRNDVWGVVDERYRYIVDRKGAEELYDHARDPEEWENVVGDPALASVRERLREELLRRTGGKLPHRNAR